MDDKGASAERGEAAELIFGIYRYHIPSEGHCDFQELSKASSGIWFLRVGQAGSAGDGRGSPTEGEPEVRLRRLTPQEAQDWLAAQGEFGISV
jgi:hypothetical protein